MTTHDEPKLGQTDATMAGDDEGLAAGATSDEAQAGDVTGGGTTTGISPYAEDGRAEDSPPIAEDDTGRINTAGQGEGTGGAEGASGDSADATGYLEAQAPAATRVDDVEGAAANASSGAAVTDEPGASEQAGRG